MASMTAIKQLTERASRLEAREKNRAVKRRAESEKAVGFTAALVTSALAGYLDGRFDMTDDTSGDGVTFFGVPAMPIAGGALALGGIATGGKVGSAMAYAGLGVGSGWAYSYAQRKGSEE